VRIFLVALLAMAGAWLLAMSLREEAPPAPPSPVVTRQKTKDCRDLCEQTAIVEQLSERYLHDCRARCEGPPVPKEPIHRITVAPANHRSTVLQK
jgi:hypothetical protein